MTLLLLRAVVFATAPFVASAIAQCTVALQPTSFPASAVVASVPFDPDGSGPLPVQLALAGDFGGAPVAIYDPVTAQVTPLPSPGFEVAALAVRQNGELVAGGRFLYGGTTPLAALARWNGIAWSWIITPYPAFMTWIGSLAVLPNGDLVVGGEFMFIGGIIARGIARWDGSAWHTLGPAWVIGGTGYDAGVTGRVNTMLLDDNGDLLVGGVFSMAGGVAASCIARWDGASWHALGAGPATGPNHSIETMVRLPNGDLFVGGLFTYVGGVPTQFAAHWDGATWHTIGGINGVHALAALPNGDVVAAGAFTLPGGNYLARWNGSTWSPIAGGLPGAARALVHLPSGDLLATASGGSFSPPVVVLRTSCPAGAVEYGVGCSGSAGPNVLRADGLPWAGATFRATATGMPSLALVLSVYGFTQLSIPMSAALPQGLPGCTIHMTPDFADVLLASSGAVHTQLPLPNTQAIAGITFHHYVVPFEFDAAFNLTAITSSNALSLTVGAW